MSAISSPRLGPAEWAMLLVLSVLWGGSFFFAKVALGELPPLTVALARVGIAALVLALLVVATGASRAFIEAPWGAFLAMGALNNAIPFTLIFWGQTAIASGLAAILNATTPLFTLVLAHVLTPDEKLNARKLAGLLAGLAGVVLLVGPDAITGSALGAIGPELLGQAAVLAAAISYAFAGIFGRRFRALPPLVPAAGQVSAATVLVVPVVLAIDRPWTLPVPGAVTWGALVALALLCTVLAYILYFRILRTAGATNLLLVTMLIPATALLLGALVLDERIAAHQVLGFGGIALGLAVVDGRMLDLFWRRLTPSG
jgi:drug/metabolite transporter (DMT)-like permease